MNKNQTGTIIQADKDKIIKMYRDNMRVKAIADKYGVVRSTIYFHLKNWGIPLERGAWNHHVKQRKHWKLSKSRELLARMAENSRINDEKIEYVKFKNTTEDQRLVVNIIDHPLLTV